MKKLVAVILFICLCHGIALAQAWPANREEIAKLNLTMEGSDFQETYKWAELWVSNNYGPDAKILSAEFVSGFSMGEGALFQDAGSFSQTAWNVSFTSQTASNNLKPENGVYQTTVRLAWVEGSHYDPQGEYIGNTTSTLTGYLSSDESIQTLPEASAYMSEDPRFAPFLRELRTEYPDNATEVDMREVFGDTQADVVAARMLTPQVMGILVKSADAKTYELFMYSVESKTVLSRHHLDTALDVASFDVEDNTLVIIFYQMENMDEDKEKERFKIKATKDGIITAETIAPDDKRLTTMPGGKTAVREGEDGSLYCVSSETGKEEKLLQGVSYEALEEKGYAAFEGYKPIGKDDLNHRMDENGKPLKLAEENFFLDDEVINIRTFEFWKPLDDHRFIYKINGWEDSRGYGIYDLAKRKDHRIAAMGEPIGLGGEYLFGTCEFTSIQTYKTVALGKRIKGDAYSVFENLDEESSYHVSPDGRWIALISTPFYALQECGVYVFETRTGKLAQHGIINNPFATPLHLSFYDQMHFQIFCDPKPGGWSYAYLFDIADK
jgi:hypothetical protein